MTMPIRSSFEGRVCLVTPSDLCADSGSTIYSRLLARTLSELDYDVTVVCATAPDGFFVSQIRTAVPLPHPYDDGQGTPPEVFQECISSTAGTILTNWKPQKGDVIHAIYPAYTAIAAGLVGVLSGCHSVVTEIGRIVNVAARNEERFRRMARYAFNSVDHVIAATPSIGNVIQDEYDVVASRVSTLLIPQEFNSRPRPSGLRCTSKSAHAPRVVTTICSSLTEEKGVFDVLEAFCDVYRKLPDRLQLTLQIVGPDPVAKRPTEKRLHQQIAKLRMEQCVSLMGFVPHDKISSLLAETDIYVDARRVDSFSSVIAEAMAEECPIVASSVRCNAEVLKPNHDALLFEPGDVGELSRSLIRLLVDASLYESIHNQCSIWFQTYRDQHSSLTHAKKIVEIYAGLE